MLTTLSVLGLAATLVPFVCALVIAVCPQHMAKWICIFAAAVSTACALFAWIGLGIDAGATQTLDIATVGDALVLGFIFDKMSVMLATAFGAP